MTPRRKMITTGALWSEKLAAIDHASERLYWRIHMASDNYGVLAGKAWDVCQKAVPGVGAFNVRAVEKALDSLEAIGLVERWIEPNGSCWVHVIGHDDHQAADFLRKRGKRLTPKPPSLRPIEQQPIIDGDLHTASADAVPCPTLPQGHQAASVAAPTTTTTTPTGSRDMSQSVKPTRDYAAEATEVFKYHTLKTWSGRGMEPQLDDKKRGRIVARLREGATVSELMQCVDGFLLSPWHNGSEGKNYLAIKTIFRDREQVEKGVELAIGAANAGAAGLVDAQTLALIARHQTEGAA